MLIEVDVELVMLRLNNVAGFYRVPFISVVEMTKRSMKRGIEGPDEGIFKIKSIHFHIQKLLFFPPLSLYIAWR